MPQPGRGARAVPTLHVRVLGGFAASVGGRAIPDDAWGSRRAQQLVKLLALAPGFRLTRDQVLDALWPDQDPDALAATLRQTCYLARRALGRADTLALRGGMVHLAPPATCTVDALAFEEAAAAARRGGSPADYAAALARYTGAVLPDDRYADWAFAPAERLRALAIALRHELAARHEAAGEHGAAAALWRAILDEEPADEAAHVGLIRGYARQGQRQEAIRQYHRLHARLRDDLALAPDAATQRLYAAILGGQFPGADAAPQPDPAAPAPRPQYALPPVLTSLIGRDAEIAAVGALLRGDARLLTLVGAGGCGKTRLARAIADDARPAFPAGVAWVSLAPLADPALLPDTVARALALAPGPGLPPGRALVEALRDRALLLVLDNCEHLRHACADLALALLAECPRLRILATSRAPLRALGEQTWPVPSLPSPGPLADGPPAPAALAALGRNDAVRLFLARAALARPGFALTPGNAAAVAAICRLVDGLPLALELAATRVALLEPRQLAGRLHDALGLLTGGPRGLPDRQQTLRATLDWSYDLLAEGERRLLAGLAAFAGGWHLDAAEAVCGGEGGDVLAGLAGLVEHSLVQVAVDAEAEEPRYRLLEPTRQYALEKLAASGRGAASAEAHARYFLALAEGAEAHLAGPDQPHWFRTLRLDIDNLRAAARWWRDRRDPETGLRFATALGHFWRQQEFLREGWDWLAAPLREGPATLTPATEAKAHLFLAMLAVMLGHAADGVRHGQRGAALYEALGDPHNQARATQYTGMNFRNLGDLAASRACLHEAARRFQQVGDRRSHVACLLNLGVAAFDQGDVREAVGVYAAALPEVRALGDARMLAMSLMNLATGALTLRDTTLVRGYLAECLAISLPFDDGTIVLHALSDFADLATLDGRWERAARLLGAAQGLHQRTGLPILRSERPFHERVEVAARAALGEAAFAAAATAGRALSRDEAVAEALAPA